MKRDERIAIYPGSFDPVTLGHEDIARRALRIADRLIVAIAHTPSQTKRGMFEVADRMELIRQVFADEPGIEVAEFQGLLVDFAHSRGAGIVVRGLRGVRDFDYEFQMALMNRELAGELETVFLAPSADRSFVSASLVREIFRLGGDVSRFVSPVVLTRMREEAGGA